MVSDITKKIFSIEQADSAPMNKDFLKPTLLHPLDDEPIAQPAKAKVADVPDFVTRDTVQPLMSPPSTPTAPLNAPKAAGWIIVAFGLLYIVGAGLYFGLPLLDQPVGLIPVAGLAILVCLPLVLLFLLWRALKHLSFISFENSKLSHAAELLVSPDAEALKRTQSLSAGVREEILKINNSLSLTAEAVKQVQTSISSEAQALDTAGAALTNRSEDVGRTLTLQRQALEGLSSTFDTRMNTLVTQITDTSQTLEGICSTSETKLLSAGEALQKATVVVDETLTSSTKQLSEKVSLLETTGQTLNSSLTETTENLQQNDSTFSESAEKLQALNSATKAQISELQATVGQGYEMLAELREAAESRASAIATLYEDLSSQIKQSEDDTLAAQGRTARMVETNLAQMRREFSKMETDLKALQAKVNNLRSASQEFDEVEEKPLRLNLRPLETDFPPVEPSRHVATPKRKPKFEPLEGAPMNLGADMEIKTLNDPSINYEPELVRRPGQSNAKPKPKGFGRRADKDEKSGWRWRDMLGGLERPDGSPASQLSQREINAVALLTEIKLSPAAIVDEGTVIDATQARISKGEPGLADVVIEKLPEAVTHLKGSLNANEALKTDLREFTAGFTTMLSNTPPTAPALRAALGSPEGRAYLLCAGAFHPELRR